MPRKFSLPWPKKAQVQDKHPAPSVHSNTETELLPSMPNGHVHVQLTYDVIDLIFREILNCAPTGDIQTMCQCALVSRSCRSLMQHYIFSNVYIESQKRCLSFLCLLVDNQDIQKSVKELYIVDKEDPCDEKTCPLSSSALPHILKILAPHGVLHSVRFRCLDNGLVEYERRRKLPRGSILTLYGGKYRGTGQNDNDPVDSGIPATPLKGNDSYVAQGKTSLPLKSLGLGGLESVNILEFLRGPYCPLDVTNLTQLTVYSVDPRTLAAVRSVLKHSGSIIERVLVYQPLKMDYWLSESLPRRGLDLSMLERLRDFAFFLRRPDHLGRNFLAWAAENQLPKKLKSISVIMTASFTRYVFRKDGREFKHLDSSLVSMIKDHICASCEVYIYVVEETDPVTERMIRDALPRTDITGMLRVKILRSLGANYVPSVDLTVYVDDRSTKNC